MKKSILFLATALVVCGGVQAATINVPADHATVQAAINAAVTGDVVQITDGATYTGSLHIPQTKENLTVVGVGTAPTLVMQHNVRRPSVISTIMAAAGAGNPALPDCSGFIVEGNGATLRNLIITDFVAAGPDTRNAVTNANQSVTVVGNNVTIEDCNIRGDNGPGDEVALVTVAGDWPTLDAIIPGGGAGDPFAATGFTTPDPVNGLTVTNCNFTSDGAGDNGIAFASVDFAVGLAVLAFGGAVYFNPLNGTGWVFNDCYFTHTDDTGQCASSGGATLNNCLFEANYDSFQVEGGTGWIFNDCLFRDSLDNELFHLAADVGLGGNAPTVTVNDSIFCGSTDQQGLVEVDEGTLFMNRCIIHVDNGLGNPSAVDWDPSDYDGAFTALLAAAPVPGPGFPATSGLSLNQCDIIMANSTDHAIEIETGTLDPPKPTTSLAVKNSIISTFGGAIGVHITPGGSLASGGSIEVENNNIFTSGTPFLAEFSWTTTSVVNNLNENPQYNDPLNCPDLATASVNLAYNNANLFTAGDAGQALGSQGPRPVVAGVDSWNLYE